MENKKSKILTLIAIITILLTLIGATYAFFAAQGSGSTSTNATVTSNTTDLLTFAINQDISFRIMQADFASGGNNKSGEATATATLIPNNKTGAASDRYYMYLNITSNPFVYSRANINQDPELMVQVFDSNNQLVSCPSLGEQKTIKGVTGYDITGVSGPVALLNNHQIIASNNETTVETWRVVITMINLDVNQNDNTGKTIEANLVVQKNSMNSLANVVEQDCEGDICGSVESVIKATKNQSEDDIYTIYTVGYITSDATSTTYSIDIRNLGVDLRLYSLELDGTPEVMTTQADFDNYIEMKKNGVPVTNLTTGNENRAVATAEELYTYSLDDTELTIDDVSLSCNMTRCIATISESFSNISSKPRHSTETVGGDEIEVLYNGIKFNLKKKRVTLWAAQLEYSNPTYTECEESQCAIDELYSILKPGMSSDYIAGLKRYQGTVADNYICFGTTNKSTCTGDTDKYMYRIIGINSSNQMKLIKKEALNTAYAWNTNKTEDVEWPDSELYAGINGSYFLTNSNYVPSGWSDRIATTNWKYGDLSNVNATAAEIATTENGFSDSTSAKIGLLYLHDYIYAVSERSLSWLYLNRVENDSSAPNDAYEWSMTRYNYYLMNNQAWRFHTDLLTMETAAVNDLESVRPVFYLTATQKIASGSGTITDPFILR